jgi:hypothetical protein
MRRAVTTFAAFLTLALASPTARPDGGAIRLDTQLGGYRIVAFTQPTPLRAGLIDLSVLVQDARTGQALPDATVTVEISSANPDRPLLRRSATHAAATNKLLRAAQFTLREPGGYGIRILVEGPLGAVSAPLTLDVSPALPSWLAQWPWLFWPVIPIALYALRWMSHGVLVHRTLRCSG